MGEGEHTGEGGLRLEARVKEDQADQPGGGEGEARLDGGRGDDIGEEVGHHDCHRRHERRGEGADL